MTDEEGARFGIACAGSRLLTGALDADRARALRDDGGTTLAEAMTAAGRDPGQLGSRRRDVAPGRHLRRAARRAGPRPRRPRRGRRRRESHLAARQMAARPARARPTTPARRGWSTAATPCPTWPALCSPRAARPRHTVPWRRSAGCGSNRAARTRCPRWCRPGSTRALPTSRPYARWSQASRARPAPLRTRSRGPVSSSSGSGLRDRLASLLGGAPVLATGAGHDAGILASAGVEAAMLFVRNPTGVSHSPAEHASRDDCLAGVEALATGARGAHPMRPYPARQTFHCDLAVLPGGRVAAGVTVEVDGGSIIGITEGAPARSHAQRLAGPGRARPGQRPLARLPPGAARPHPGADRRSRLVLDVARADVLRRRTAHPRQLSHAGPRRLCRDGAGGHHHGRRVPLPSTTAPTDARTTTRTPWAMRSCRLRATPDCASPCWTRAISPAVSTNRSRECRDGSTTAQRSGGGARHRSRDGVRRRGRRRRRGGHSLRPRRAGRPPGTGRRLGGRARRTAARPPVRAARRERRMPPSGSGSLRPGCLHTTGCSAPGAAALCMRLISPMPTSGCWATRRRPCACAPRRSATWPTASARPSHCAQRVSS
jgi:hypothetical protein